MEIRILRKPFKRILNRIDIEFNMIMVKCLFTYKRITKLLTHKKKQCFDYLQCSDTGITQFSVKKSILVILVCSTHNYLARVFLF